VCSTYQQEEIKMKLMIFEGSSEELKSAAPLLGLDPRAVANAGAHGSSTVAVVPSAPPASAAAIEGGKLTEEVATVFLTRRALPKTQRDVLRAIKNANGAGITSSELAKQIGCGVDMVKGAMRSFGKKAAHTEGWPEKLPAFIRTWEGSENRYRLHPEILSVLESGKVPL
jgi:hypothetical protein